MNFIKRHKRVFIISLCVLCLLLITITVAYRRSPTLVERALSAMTTPIQSGITAVGNWVGGKISFLATMSSLNDENQRLRDENAILTIENSRLRQVNEDNESLIAQLDTKSKYSDFPVTNAKVVGYDPGNWYYRFIVDKGENQGIMKNLAVLADGALIGRIVEVWSNSARVESIINDTSAVSAKNNRTNDVGYVHGDASLMMDGLCLMEFTNIEVDIAVGDEISTSQLSSIYPPGIAIGTVTQVNVDSRGATTAVIKPIANFSLVEHVFIITELYDIY